MRTNTIDIFTHKLFDYGSLQLFADTTKETARLQLSAGAYQLPLVATMKKEDAFSFYNNCSLNTFNEVSASLRKNGGR